VWRVGNGDHIKIWGDKWTFSTSSHRIHSPVKDLGLDARVSVLIDQGSGCWFFTLIHSIFELVEADAVCAMSLSPFRGPDKLVWSGSKFGLLFSVKSAYHLELQRKAMMTGESSTLMENQGLWRTLWALKLPGVTKNFVWKVYQNLLPTKTKLFHKNIVHDPFCPLCFSEVETSSHILWHCSSSLAGWQEFSCRAQKLSHRS